jgi:hypothetical protein
MLVSVQLDRLDRLPCRAGALTTFNFLQEVMAGQLACCVLLLAAEFFVTSHGTLSRFGNFGTSPPVGVIIMVDVGMAC